MRKAARSLPEQAQELTQGELEGDQELCFVQEGESLFTCVTFNNHLNTQKTHQGSASSSHNTKSTGDQMHHV